MSCNGEKVMEAYVKVFRGWGIAWSLVMDCGILFRMNIVIRNTSSPFFSVDSQGRTVLGFRRGCEEEGAECSRRDLRGDRNVGHTLQ